MSYLHKGTGLNHETLKTDGVTAEIRLRCLPKVRAQTLSLKPNSLARHVSGFFDRKTDVIWLCSRVSNRKADLIWLSSRVSNRKTDLIWLSSRVSDRKTDVIWLCSRVSDRKTDVIWLCSLVSNRKTDVT
jgi:hypothetical protein